MAYMYGYIAVRFVNIHFWLFISSKQTGNINAQRCHIDVNYNTVRKMPLLIPFRFI